MLKKRFDEMSKSVNETINYLDGCSEEELFWATEVLEDLSEHFKSKELIECIDKNLQRCKDQRIINQLKITLGYMKEYV